MDLERLECESTAVGYLSKMSHLDAHERPPEALRLLYKKYQKIKPLELAQDLDVLDFAQRPETKSTQHVKIVRFIASCGLNFTNTSEVESPESDRPIEAYESDRLPGPLDLFSLGGIHF